MEFRQLELFIAVAEELHFGRAAARIGMAQPPFSQQIRRLEAELGVTLLHRTSRRVALTAVGERLLADAHDLLRRRQEVVATVRRCAAGELGTVRVGFRASSAFGLLPRIVRAFRELRGATGTAELAVAYPAKHLSPIAAHFRTIAHAALAALRPASS